MAQQQAEAEVERRQRQLLWDEREVQRLAAVRQAKRMAAGYLLGTWVGTNGGSGTPSSGARHGGVMSGESAATG